MMYAERCCAGTEHYYMLSAVLGLSTGDAACCVSAMLGLKTGDAAC